MLEKVGIVAVVVVALLVAVYLVVMWATWQELRYARHCCQKYTKELGQLKLAHGSILQAIDLIKDNMTKCNGGEMRFQERKLADMQKALEKNERKTKEAEDQLEKYQSEVTMSEESLRRLWRFAWLKNH